MRVLGRKDLERFLTPLKTIGAMERAFRQYALGEAALLSRQAMKVTKGGILLVMPAALRSPSSEAGSGALGVKLVTVYEENRDRGLPTLHASYLLFDHETGAPLALIEGSFLTGMRTGATSAVAARALARPDSQTAACFGAFTPETREVDTETVARARVAVDSYAGAWEETGDLLIPLKEGAIGKEHVRAELAELVTGTKPGRTNRQEITLFKSVGSALEDAAAARLAYDEARAAGVGVEVDLE